MQRDDKRFLRLSAYFVDKDAFSMESLVANARPLSAYGRIDQMYRLACRNGLLAEYSALIDKHLSGQPADNIDEAAIDALSSAFGRILSPCLAANERERAQEPTEPGNRDQSTSDFDAALIRAIQFRASEIGIKVFLDFFARSQFGTDDLSLLTREQLNDLSSHLDRYADYASRNN